jgi:peroxidase
MYWKSEWLSFAWDYVCGCNPWGDNYGGYGHGSKKEYYALTYLEARSPDGHNNDGDNNPLNDKGVHDSTFLRITENSYPDGVGALPAQSPGLGIAVDGPLPTPSDPGAPGRLPAPRAVSNAVMAQGTADIPNSDGINEFFQFFGQALTHDLAEAATGPSGDAPVFLAALFPFGRTPYEIEDGVRQQINEETSFLDLSMVYGNSQAMLDLVRADLPGGGQSAKLLVGTDNLLPTIKEVAEDAGLTSLQVLAIYRPAGFGGLPDPATNPDPATFENLFFAGDNRVNQTPLLISQQTIWAREHNWQVDRLEPYAEQYGWTQDQLFEAARAITEAEWQNVVYNEYLPKLIGEHALDSYGGYDPSVDPSIINEFTTVAFRFGHDQSSQNQKPLNEDGSAANPGGLFSLFTLAEAFTHGANAARTSENIDEWLRGQLASHTQEIDGLVVDGNRNTLFNIGGGAVTIDLEVFDIMRARDHGVWNYNDLREGLGLATYANFDDYGTDNGLDPVRLQALKDVYGDDIDKLDSIIGGLLEAKFYDSQLGETFTKIIAIQFENLREGDRLYYENRFECDPKLLCEIENTSLTDILKRTTGIDYLYRDAFAAHDRVSDTDGTVHGSGEIDLAIGSDWKDLIKTYGGDDDIYAGKGNDYIFAGYGDDYIWTGEGKDIVVLDLHSGYDVVHDFNKKYDKLDLTEYGIDSWKEVKQAAHQTKDGVIIWLNSYSSVELADVAFGGLSKKNFVFNENYDYGVT